MPVLAPWHSPQLALNHLLKATLKFGDDDQIKCVQVLHEAELLIGADHQCTACDGDGETDGGECSSCGHECEYCGGECKTCGGSGGVKWSRDQVYAMTADTIRAILGNSEESRVD